MKVNNYNTVAPALNDKLFGTDTSNNNETANFTIQSIANLVTGGLFAQTSTSPVVTNTTTESSIVDGGVGTLTVPANGFSVGDSFVAHLTGHISSANNQGLHIRIKSGSVVLADANLTIPTTTTKHWTLDITFTIRAIGAAGIASIASGGMFTYNKDASTAFDGLNFSTENNTTFDTTVSNTLDITAQWSAANTANIIYSEVFTLTKIK